MVDDIVVWLPRGRFIMEPESAAERFGFPNPQALEDGISLLDAEMNRDGDHSLCCYFAAFVDAGASMHHHESMKDSWHMRHFPPHPLFER
jgi:hypothetical protein